MKVLNKALTLMAGIGVGIYIGRKIKKTETGDMTQRIRADKNASVIATLNQLFMSVQNQKNIADYLKSQGYNTLAIYGMGNVGSRLYDELKNSDVKVLFGIDSKTGKYMEGLKIVTVDEITDEPDIIIVTPVYSFDEIAESLAGKVSCPIVSIEDVLNKIGTVV